MKKQLSFLLIICSLVIFSPQNSTATTTTFNALFFQPASGRSPYLMLHSSRGLYQFQYQLGEIVSFGYRPLSLRATAGSRLQDVIDYSVATHFSAAYGFTDFLQLGIDFPVIVLNRFQSPDVFPGTGAANKFSLGDLRIEPKLSLLDASKHRVGLAVIPFFSIPTGKSENYVADASYTYGAKLAVDVLLARRLTGTLNAGYQTGERVNIRNINYKHRFLLGGGVNFQTNDRVGFFVEANTNGALNDLFKNSDLNQLEVIGGSVFTVADSGIEVKAAAGSCVVCGVGGARLRTVLGASYRYNADQYKLKDKQYKMAFTTMFDNVIAPHSYYDLKISCPVNAEDFEEGVHDDACPKYYEIREVAEIYFACPDAESYVAGKHDAACEKVFTLAENFSPEEVFSIVSLSIVEMNQRCPKDPNNFDSKYHDLACQKFYDLSSAVQLASNCPADANNYQTGVHDQSCPKFFVLRDKYSESQWSVVTLLTKQDSDGDGIEDFNDLCPDKREDFNDFIDDDGCPDKGKTSTIVAGEIKTLQPVYFKFNESSLSASSKEGIDQVIDMLDKNTWIKRLYVGGHADNVGSKGVNYEVSAMRANGVIYYLRKKGVRRDVKLVPVIYGSKQPVVPNTSAANRAKNRRAVFTIDTNYRGR